MLIENKLNKVEKFTDLKTHEREYLKGSELGGKEFEALDPVAKQEWVDEAKNRSYKDSFVKSHAKGSKSFLITNNPLAKKK